MTGAAALLLELAALGLRAEVSPQGGLRLRGAQRPPPALRAQVPALAPALVRVAGGHWREDVKRWPAWRLEVFEERVAIMLDGGVAPDVAEQAAYLDVAELPDPGGLPGGVELSGAVRSPGLPDAPSGGRHPRALGDELPDDPDAGGRGPIELPPDIDPSDPAAGWCADVQPCRAPSTALGARDGALGGLAGGPLPGLPSSHRDEPPQGRSLEGLRARSKPPAGTPSPPAARSLPPDLSRARRGMQVFALAAPAPEPPKGPYADPSPPGETATSRAARYGFRLDPWGSWRELDAIGEAIAPQRPRFAVGGGDEREHGKDLAVLSSVELEGVQERGPLQPPANTPSAPSLDPSRASSWWSAYRRRLAAGLNEGSALALTLTTHGPRPLEA